MGMVGFTSFGVPLNFVPSYLVQLYLVLLFSFKFWPQNCTLWIGLLQFWSISFNLTFENTQSFSLTSHLKQFIWVYVYVPDQYISVSWTSLYITHKYSLPPHLYCLLLFLTTCGPACYTFQSLILPWYLIHCLPMESSLFIFPLFVQNYYSSYFSYWNKCSITSDMDLSTQGRYYCFIQF